MQPTTPRAKKTTLTRSRKLYALSLLSRPKELFHLLVDRDAPMLPKLAAAAALAYVVMPFDLIPDVVPVLGWLDDFGIVAVAFAYVARKAAEHAEGHRGERKLIPVPTRS